MPKPEVSFTCENCGPTEDWTFYTFFENEMYCGCRQCGYRAKSPIPSIFATRKIIYLDQFAITYMLEESSPTWKRLKEQLLLLTSRQLWICPLFQNHFDETSELPTSVSREHFNLIQRLANGRLFKDPQDIKDLQCLDAFRAFQKGENNWKSDYRDGFLILDPGSVIPPFSVLFTEDLKTLRPPGGEHYLRRARESHMELRQFWAENPMPIHESRQEEHNFVVEIHVDMLSVMTTGKVPASSPLLKPGMFEIYLKSVGQSVAMLLLETDNGPQAPAQILKFLESRHFGTVAHIAIDNVLIGYLRDQMKSYVGKQVNWKKQEEKHRGDLKDASFISLVLPYVTDIFVDARFEELLRKPKMRRHVGQKLVWTTRTVEELSTQAQELLDSDDFAIVNAVFSKLAPLEENEFVPRTDGQRLIYGGELI